MKNLLIYLLLLAGALTAIAIGCKKGSDPKPDNNLPVNNRPNRKTVPVKYTQEAGIITITNKNQ